MSVTDQNELAVQKFDVRHSPLGNKRVWFYAISAHTVVGQLSVDMEQPDFAWINDLYVTPSLRRKGIASSMIAKALECAAENLKLGCCAGIKHDNDYSRALFTKLGFVYAYRYEENSCLYSRLFVEVQS